MTNRQVREDLVGEGERNYRYTKSLLNQIEEQKMTKDKLKSCPFCGNPYANKPRVSSYYNSYTGRQYFIECTYCFAVSRHTNSEKEAILAWNRRVDND